MRISATLEAKEILIEIGEDWGDIQNLQRWGWRVIGGKDAFLSSLTRRAKYDFLLWEVVADGHEGVLPKQIVYDGSSIGWDTPYRVVDTNPTGDVQITPQTKIKFNLHLEEDWPKLI
jgi:hypothetical protein